MRKFLATLLILGLSIPTVFLYPQEAQAAASAIRQEINITNGYLYAASGSYATSSAIISLDGSKYSGTKTCYFEAVASTTAGTDATVALVTTAGASTASVTVNGGNVYQIYRSSSFTCPTTATEYKTRLGNEAIGKGIIASRVIVTQSFADDANSAATSTQTQIEIGTQLTATTSITSLPLQNTKYWTFSGDKWDGSTTTYAEVTYSLTAQIASSTTYASAGTFTYNVVASTSDVIVDAWGAGGAGFDGSNSGGGEGGGGGAFASSTIPTTASSYSLTVGTGGSTSGAAGTNSTFNTSTVIADAGDGGANAVGTAGRQGLASQSTGTTKFNGGNGGAGNTTDDGGGGGGGAGGPHGAGGTAQDASTTTGGDGGNGNNGSGGAGGNGGGQDAQIECDPGFSNANGGGGGGGADQAKVGCQGGAPGGGGGGGEGGQGNGAAGQIKLTAMTGYVGIALEEDNGSFGGWTFKTQILNKGTSTTATRVRSSAFTAVNGRHYRLVASTTASNVTYNIYNGKIILDQIGISGTNVSSYSEANQDLGLSLASNNFLGLGQSFSGTGATLGSAVFYLKKTGSPTGNIVAKIYTAANNPIGGGNDTPTGAALATSDNYDSSNLTTSYQLITFNFSGANQITLTNGTVYDVTVEYSGGSFPNDTVEAGYDSFDNTHPGDKVQTTGTWAATANQTAIFYVYSVSVPNPTLLEPQYQLAPTTLSSGTSLQKYLTSFNTSEWSGVANTYLLDVDAANDSTSVVVLKDSTDATTYATVSSPDNVGTSTLTCIPTSNTTWDTKASTNNNDVFGVRILTQVSIGGAGGTSNCATDGNTPPKFFFINSTVRFTDGTVRFSN